MKISIGLFLPLVIFTVGIAQTEPLPRERQQEIIDAFLYVTGQAEAPSQALMEDAALTDEGHPIIKCGMPIVMDLMLNRDRFDKELLQAAGINLSARPSLMSEETYDSPAGLFKIHYTQVGEDAVDTTDAAPQNGVPDYVDSTAWVLDSVHMWIVDSLGYPPPPRDDFYPEGGDSLYDVYLEDLASGAYGLTWGDWLYIGPDSQQATSFMVLDRNYEGLPQYANRPLDAIRVTAAHEYFHAVQFGIDFTEAEIYETGLGTVIARYWMEMSAVWMEEKLYDEINDYYDYLPYFFNDPRLSLQQFNNYTDLRPYANGIFAIFLEQYYGDELIHAIWEECGRGGPGPDFLFAANAEIDTLTQDTLAWFKGRQQWPHAVREFTLWNWFTGERADLAPDTLTGYEYEERIHYPAFPDDKLMYAGSYPVTTLANENPLNPLHNGANYLILDSTKFIPPDTTYWLCNTVLDSTCTDSLEVAATAAWDFFRIDCSSRDTTYWVCASWSDSVCGGRVRRSITQDWDFSIAPCSAIVDGADTTYMELLPRYYKCTLWVDSRCIDSLQTNEAVGYDWMAVDSMLRLELSLGTDSRVPPLVQPWGVSIMYRMAENPDSVEIDRFLLPDNVTSVLAFPAPSQYEQIVVALSPATYSNSTSFYKPFPLYLPMDIGYLATANLVPPEVVPTQPAMVYPYPNPFNASITSHEEVTFRVKTPMDQYGEPVTDEPEILIDLFTVAGERVRTVSGAVPVGVPSEGMWDVQWDLRNANGREVASGAYIAVMRMYESSRRRELVAESQTKVAVIR